jgi:uncharacterized protein YkwD
MKKAVKIKTEYHKKRYGHHQKRNKRFQDTYFPYLPMTILVFLSIFISGHNPKQNTLAYATEMSRQSLLSSTNSQRSNYGKSQLTISEQLNSAAQAKANDMVSRNYWSHNTPDGKEPWVFINSSGYSYFKAGENLAYGFSTSDTTVNGWMNSPSHKENLLDTDFSEVGFGYANSSDFNNSGQETVVVAMYGKPYVLASTSQTDPEVAQQAPPASSATQPTTLPVQPTTTTQQNTETTQPVSEKSESIKNEDQNNITSNEVVVASQKSVSRVETLTGNLPTWLIGSVTFGVGFLIAILMLRHAVRLRKLLKDSKNFVTHHPLIDSTIVGLIILGVTLLRSVGNIL